MSLTVLTGTPGAGKTLHAIEKLILPMVGTSISHTDSDGVTTEIPRVIYTNIKGLQVDHELIDDGDKGGLKNWHEWAKPGSMIVYDEFQKVMPPRANGSAVPPFIQHLDTHRHMGVDFVFITQNVMNVDRHVHGLTGRHIHVRRMGNLPFAIVYEWDHCSRQLLYSKAISQGTWRFNKAVYKLYHSADLHTKQPRKIPILVWFILSGLVGAPVLAYNVYQSYQEKLKPAGLAARPTTTFSVTPYRPASAPVAPGSIGHPTGVFPVALGRLAAAAGCAVVRDRCDCYSSDGIKVEPDISVCEALKKPALPVGHYSLSSVPNAITERDATAAALRDENDGAVLRWMLSRK